MDNIAKLEIVSGAIAQRWRSVVTAQLFVQIEQPEANCQSRPGPPISPQELADRRLTARHPFCQRLLSEPGSEQFFGDFFGIHEQLLHMYFELPIPMYLKYLLQS